MRSASGWFCGRTTAKEAGSFSTRGWVTRRGLAGFASLALLLSVGASAQTSATRLGPGVDAALGASARAAGAKTSDARSASVQVTFTLTVESALSMTVETVEVADSSACDGGSARAELVQTPGGGSIHFGSGIVPHLPSTVTNGCAVRAEGAEPGLHLIAALRSTLQVAGFPAASVHIARGEAPGGYAQGQFPEESVRFMPGNPSVAGWRRGGAGYAVPSGRGSPLVRGATSGESAVQQIALFVPDGAPSGAYRASVLLSMTAE